MDHGTKCKWCGISTASISDDECDQCCELRFRIADNPALALKILQSLGKNNKKLKTGATGGPCCRFYEDNGHDTCEKCGSYLRTD